MDYQDPIMIGLSHNFESAEIQSDFISVHEVDPIHETVTMNFCLIKSDSDSVAFRGDL